MTTRRKFVQHLSLALAGAPVLPILTQPLQPAPPKTVSGNLIEPKAASTDTTADILVDKLIAWGVDVVFGITGDGIIPLVDAFRKKKDRIRYITVRHEESAAFMASGYAKYTGRLGVCMATTGPGAVHLMNGLYDASMEGAPVLALTGIIDHDLLGTQFTQEVDTIKMVQDLAIYNQEITGPQQALTIVDLACRTALMTPGVAHLTISTDTQAKTLGEDKPSKKAGHLTGSSTTPIYADLPSADELGQAATILNSSSKIMILAGRGALGAREEIEKLADKLGAPVAKALLGKTLLPDDSPFTTGGTGKLGTMPSKQMMAECDVLLILGSNMPHLEYYPKEAVGIQIDRNPRRIGLRYPVKLGLTGDVKTTVQSLLTMVNQHQDRGFLQLARQRMTTWRGTLAKLEGRSTTPIKPQFLVAAVSKLMADDAVVAIDTGAHTVFTARHWQARKGQQLAVCGNLASMAPALPYAIAAQLAYPGRQCIAMVGDGSFTMLMGEMATAVFYKLPVKVILFKNNLLAMDRFEQEEAGYPDFSVALQPIDFAAIATACGAEGYTVAKPDALEATLRKALQSAGPAVVQVEVDPDENPAAPEKISV